MKKNYIVWTFLFISFFAMMFFAGYLIATRTDWIGQGNPDMELIKKDIAKERYEHAYQLLIRELESCKNSNQKKVIKRTIFELNQRSEQAWKQILSEENIKDYANLKKDIMGFQLQYPFSARQTEAIELLQKVMEKEKLSQQLEALIDQEGEIDQVLNNLQGLDQQIQQNPTFSHKVELQDYFSFLVKNDIFTDTELDQIFSLLQNKPEALPDKSKETKDKFINKVFKLFEQLYVQIHDPIQGQSSKLQKALSLIQNKIEESQIQLQNIETQQQQLQQALQP